jgi:hypothetical protein
MTKEDNGRVFTKDDCSEILQTTIIKRGFSAINLNNSLKNVSGSATRLVNFT